MSQHLYSLTTVFVLGLVFGMGPCTITCLPFLGPVFLAKQGGLKQSWKIILPFSLGRLSSYATLGALSGMAGASIQKMIKTPMVAWFLGGATIAVGLIIFWRTYRRKTGCGSHGKRPMLQDHPLLPSGLFFMGVGMAATPCAPLTTVMITAAATSDGVSGLLLGLSFGAGAVFVPALAFGVGMAYFGQRIRQILYGWRTPLERASALMLVFIGGTTILG
ncbi:MAG: sulfite exporter TauE/SafE family protein [Methylobacter sp.]